MLDTRIPKVRLFPLAKDRAWRFGEYLSSSAALSTRARVALFTTIRLFSTRETVAIDTPAFFATASRLLRSACFACKMTPKDRSAIDSNARQPLTQAWNESSPMRGRPFGHFSALDFSSGSASISPGVYKPVRVKSGDGGRHVFRSASRFLQFS